MRTWNVARSKRGLEMKSARLRRRVLLGVRYGVAMLAALGGFGPQVACVAGASAPVTTYAAPVLNGNASGTITSTNTFQSIWSATDFAKPRVGCLVINTSTNRQWVYFGTTPTKAAAIPLEAAAATAALGGNVSCSTGAGGAAQDQVWITGTSGDTFVATQE